MRKRNDATLADLGEWGFLRRLLPRLQRRARGAFLVPPGDDAAVLAGGERPVLSIDGLTENTHFRARWDARTRALLGVSLARALAWKLVGSCVSDLASMGATRRRWAMIYLGAPGSARASFLEDLYRGIDESARRFDVALAGGDTVRAAQVTMVAAVGAGLVSRPLTRRGARENMRVCVSGPLGGAAAGLAVLDGKIRLPAGDAKTLVKSFFDVRPDLELGARLAKEPGVGGAMDVSDALSDCAEIFCRDSGVGAEIDLDALPVPAAFRRHFPLETALSGGEDYALLFAAAPATAARLERAGLTRVVGRFTARRAGVAYLKGGWRIARPRSFQHFP